MCNILGAGCGPPTNFIDWTYFNSLAAVFIVTVSIEIWLLFLLWCEWYDWIWFFFFLPPSLLDHYFFLASCNLEKSRCNLTFFSFRFTPKDPWHMCINFGFKIGGGEGILQPWWTNSYTFKTDCISVSMLRKEIK